MKDTSLSLSSQRQTREILKSLTIDGFSKGIKNQNEIKKEEEEKKEIKNNKINLEKYEFRF